MYDNKITRRTGCYKGAGLSLNMQNYIYSRMTCDFNCNLLLKVTKNRIYDLYASVSQIFVGKSYFDVPIEAKFQYYRPIQN